MGTDGKKDFSIRILPVHMGRTKGISMKPLCYALITIMGRKREVEGCVNNFWGPLRVAVIT